MPKKIAAVQPPKRGFTLIELLVVITVLGVLVVIAIPRFSGARERAYRAQMQTDLRTLVVAQESYFQENTTYTTQVDQLDFNPNPNVKLTVIEATGAGWSVQATHSNTSIICGFYAGPVTPPPDVTPPESVIECTD